MICSQDIERDHESQQQAADKAAFGFAKLTDATLNAMLRNGSSLEGIIVELIKEKQRYICKVMDLESINPKRILMPDGTILVWHCPDELVPIQRISNSERKAGENHG